MKKNGGVRLLARMCDAYWFNAYVCLLFQRNNTNHEVTITLFSRIFYKASSIHEFPDYMQENVQQDFRNMFYEDFYRYMPVLT